MKIAGRLNGYAYVKEEERMIKVSDYIYHIWLSNTPQTAVLTGEQGYLCLQRFLNEGGEDDE